MAREKEEGGKGLSLAREVVDCWPEHRAAPVSLKAPSAAAESSRTRPRTLPSRIPFFHNSKSQPARKPESKTARKQDGQKARQPESKTAMVSVYQLLHQSMNSLVKLLLMTLHIKQLSERSCYLLRCLLLLLLLLLLHRRSLLAVVRPGKNTCAEKHRRQPSRRP